MKKLKDILFWTIIGIMIAFIIFYSYKIYERYKHDKENARIQAEIAVNASFEEDDDDEYFSFVDESKFPTEVIETPKEVKKTYTSYSPDNGRFLSVNFDSLWEENKNVVAWLYIPDTEVNHPVVQTTDNKYYLNHNYNEQYNSAGWIFGDYRSTFDSLGRNTVIYGHNLSSGGMFGSLKKLNKTKDWFDTPGRNYIYLDTPKASYVFKMISIYTTGETVYIKHSLSDDNTFRGFIDYVMSHNTIDKVSESAGVNDNILTLSTCQSGQRLTIQAKLISTKPHKG